MRWQNITFNNLQGFAVHIFNIQSFLTLKIAIIWWQLTIFFPLSFFLHFLQALQRTLSKKVYYFAFITSFFLRTAGIDNLPQRYFKRCFFCKAFLLVKFKQQFSVSFCGQDFLHNTRSLRWSKFVQAVGWWITWFILILEESNYFHSNWSKIVIFSENSCHFFNLLSFGNNYFLLSFR